MKRTAFIACTIITVVYLVVGAVVFYFIEGGKERKVKFNFAHYHDAFLHNHSCITPEVLKQYVLQLLEAQAHGVNVADIVSHNTTNTSHVIDDDLEHTSWDMASTFLFCLTVISTIGYGNISPKTKGGQLFCIFYALIGIPLFGTTLVGVGERLQIPLKKIKKGRPWLKSHPDRDAQLKTYFFLSTGILILIFIPAAVIANTENWSFVESLYFCIITLTTVGFGDYVPGQDTGKHLNYLYRLILAVWIMLGLSWIALILSEVASLLQSNIIRAARTTQSRLGDLEGIVKKKARETRDRIAQKASSRRRSTALKDKEKGSTPTEELEGPQFGQHEDGHPYNANDSTERPGHKLEETCITGDYHRLSKGNKSPEDAAKNAKVRAEIPGRTVQDRAVV